MMDNPRIKPCHIHTNFSNGRKKLATDETNKMSAKHLSQGWIEKNVRNLEPVSANFYGPVFVQNE